VSAGYILQLQVLQVIGGRQVRAGGEPKEENINIAQVCLHLPKDRSDAAYLVTNMHANPTAQLSVP
jgi:hypothetical protein